MSSLPYRPGVGIMMINAEDLVFVARRRDKSDAWQMPQGGIDPGETPTQTVFRELEEEIGTANVTVLAESANWLRYDLPRPLVGRSWSGRWRGQEQKWFLARFQGQDAEINLATEHPEFDAWRWVDPRQLVSLIVPFKRPVYEQVLEEFLPYLRSANASLAEGTGKA